MKDKSEALLENQAIQIIRDVIIDVEMESTDVNSLERNSNNLPV
jgi:hypothetical protein